MKRKILYIDMDNVLVDFRSGIERLDGKTRKRFEGDLDDAPDIFGLMDPMPGAVEAFHTLAEHFDVYILSTAPWNNSTAWSDKLKWVKRYLGDSARKRLILTHHKNLNKGDYLIDDRIHKRGVQYFEGEVLHFGPDGKFPDWDAVLDYLLPSV